MTTQLSDTYPYIFSSFLYHIIPNTIDDSIRLIITASGVSTFFGGEYAISTIFGGNRKVSLEKKRAFLEIIRAYLYNSLFIAMHHINCTPHKCLGQVLVFLFEMAKVA